MLICCLLIIITDPSWQEVYNSHQIEPLIHNMFRVLHPRIQSSQMQSVPEAMQARILFSHRSSDDQRNQRETVCWQNHKRGSIPLKKIKKTIHAQPQKNHKNWFLFWFHWQNQSGSRIKAFVPPRTVNCKLEAILGGPTYGSSMGSHPIYGILEVTPPKDSVDVLLRRCPCHQ